MGLGRLLYMGMATELALGCSVFLYQVLHLHPILVGVRDHVLQK